MVKIAFIGAHGVGKTTLCYNLTGEMKKLGLNVTMLTEVARQCPLPINKGGGFESQLWIMTRQISEELSHLKDHDHLVCDRSILDTYIYHLVLQGEDGLLSKLLNHWIGSYDFLFKVPIKFPLVEDGVRDTDNEFQKKVDQVMDRLLKDRNIKHYILPEGDEINFIKDTVSMDRLRSKI